MFRSRFLNGLLVLVCLALAGVVLRAWLPADIWRPPQRDRRPPRPPDFSQEGLLPDSRTWRGATPQERRDAVKAARGQLLAFRADDYVRADTFQASALRRRMSSSEGLRAMITRQYPEYAHSRSITFGAVHADPAGRHVDVAVAVTGQNGLRSRALYLMVREGSAYRVGGVTNIVTERPRERIKK